MSESHTLPPRLTAALAADPPRQGRLARPWKRVLWLAPLAALILSWVTLAYGLRRDLATLGPLLSVGASLAQIVGGLVLLAGALAEAVPGRQLSRRQLASLALATLAGFVALTLATDTVTATAVPPGREARYVTVCLGRPPLLALPLLMVALLLAFRAFPVRPVLLGALCGLGCGLTVDAAWRLFCEVSDPRHVLVVHGGAMLLSTTLGALSAWLLAWLGGRRSPTS